VTLALVMLGAALGAPLRWWVDRAVQARHDSVFPWGTFTVNVLGSFVLGVVAAAATRGSPWYALLGTGFCGGFTTFSTFSFENVRLWEQGSGRIAAFNLAGSVAAGLAAAFAGWMIGSALA
jgi:CrcB protein